MNAAQLINQTSGTVEYYTPSNIIEAARLTMGCIDLDPASCMKANETVKAIDYFTTKDDGLSEIWYGNVWMNHPFSAGEEACKPNCKKKACQPDGKRGHCISHRIPSNGEWIDKLIREFDFQNIEQACCITFACTSEAWYKPLLRFPQCYLSPRTNYIGPDGQPVPGVTKGSVVTYLGPNVTDFITNFEPLGSVVIPAAMWRQRAHSHMCDLRVAYENGQREAVTV